MAGKRAQNRRAGSTNVIELHGNLEDVRCSKCGQTSARPGEALPELPTCDACGDLLRPGVVWFGESLPAGAWASAEAAARGADVLLVVGTSAVVYPAAMLIDVARAAGAAAIEVNPTPTDAAVTLRLVAPASTALPALVAGVRQALI